MSKYLRAVPRASDASRPLQDRYAIVQRVDNGLVLGSIGPIKDGSIGYTPDGTSYSLSAKALQEIIELIQVNGVALAE